MSSRRGILPAGLGELVVDRSFQPSDASHRYPLGRPRVLAEKSCECRRPIQSLIGIVGRAYDTILDADGRSFHPEAVLICVRIASSNGAFISRISGDQRNIGELTIAFETSDTISDELMRAVTQEFQVSLGSALAIHIETTPSARSSGPKAASP